MTSWDVPVLRTSAKTAIAERKEAPTEPHASQEAHSWEYLVPQRPLMITANSGKTGIRRMSQSVMGTASPLQEVHFVDIRRDLSPKDDNNNGEPDCCFSGGNRNDKERHELPSHRLHVIRKGDEIDVRGIQHDLDRHQYDDEIAPDQDAQ